MIFVRLLLIVVIAVGTYLTLDVAYASTEDTKIALSPIPSGSVAGASTSAVASQTFGPELGKAIDDALAGTRGTYSVIIKDLTTGETYTKNPDKTYDTASLYKLWVMGETFHQIEEGKIKETDGMSNTVEGLNKAMGISSESAELTEGDFTMTVSEALNRMITLSHNYAAYLLTMKVKSSNITRYLKDNGLTNSRIGPKEPMSTPSDIALFLEKLYRKELASPESTQKMLDLMAGQQINDRIPKYLPKDIRVMHKTGELDRVKHDVGIVSTPTGDYLIVLMSDSSDQLAAAERLANVSKGIYEYMAERTK